MVVLSIRKREMLLVHTQQLYMETLHVGSLEVKFYKSPVMFYCDIIGFFLKNQFRLLDDVKYNGK